MSPREDSESDTPHSDDPHRSDSQSVAGRPKHTPPADPKTRARIAHFVTTIKNAEQQVGEHIIGALQHPDTVAVLTTVAIGPDGQQQIISAALNPQRMKQVQEILRAAEQEREEETPCLGFHCLINPKPEEPTPED